MEIRAKTDEDYEKFRDFAKGKIKKDEIEPILHKYRGTFIKLCTNKMVSGTWKDFAKMVLPPKNSEVYRLNK